MESNLNLYLLAIRGTLASSTLEAARKIHNSTAGAPENIAVVQSLGDLSHMVYVPMEPPKSGAGEFLIMDTWTSPEGINQFFSNPTVQEQAGQIFSQRDPVVWRAAKDFTSYHMPAPYGMNDRILTTARGMLKSLDMGCGLHNASIAKTIGKARKAGNLSHEAYLRLAAPGSPEAQEFFAADVWMSAEAMMEFYDDPEFLEGFDHMFTAEATTAVWTHPKGDWAEW
ncbi:MAG TPA: hypothetical protein VF784_00010 [Anaerolineales bacterium]